MVFVAESDCCAAVAVAAWPAFGSSWTTLVSTAVAVAYPVKATFAEVDSEYAAVADQSPFERPSSSVLLGASFDWHSDYRPDVGIPVDHWTGLRFDGGHCSSDPPGMAIGSTAVVAAVDFSVTNHATVALHRPADHPAAVAG